VQKTYAKKTSIVQYLGRRHSWLPGRTQNLWDTVAVVSELRQELRIGIWNAPNTETPRVLRRQRSSRRNRSS